MEKDDFFRAVTFNNMIKTLEGLNSGIDVGLQDDHDQWSALHYAVYHDRYEIAELLIMRGADVNLKNYSNLTPLMFAEHYEHPEHAELLIKNKAEKSAPGNAEKTASPKAV